MGCVLWDVLSAPDTQQSQTAQHLHTFQVEALTIRGSCSALRQSRPLLRYSLAPFPLRNRLRVGTRLCLRSAIAPPQNGSSVCAHRSACSLASRYTSTKWWKEVEKVELCRSCCVVGAKGTHHPLTQPQSFSWFQPAPSFYKNLGR